MNVSFAGYHLSKYNTATILMAISGLENVLNILRFAFCVTCKIE